MLLWGPTTLGTITITTVTNAGQVETTLGDTLQMHRGADLEFAESSDNLEVEYPALASWLTEKAGSECPVQISLGESGQYYARLHNGSWNCSLPWRIRVAVNDSVNRVWLGYKKKCAMQKKSGELVLDSMQLGYPAMFEKLLSECHQECNVRVYHAPSPPPKKKATGQQLFLC